MVSFNYKLIDKFFRISLLIKLVDAIIEIGGGILMFFVNFNSIYLSINNFFKHEVAEHPSNIIFNLGLDFIGSFSPKLKLFVAIYLLVHGAIKIFLFWALWTRRFRLYPLAGIILILFLFYEVYRFIVGHSLFILFLIIVDIVIIALLVFEYHFRKKYKKEK